MILKSYAKQNRKSTACARINVTAGVSSWFHHQMHAYVRCVGACILWNAGGSVREGMTMKCDKFAAVNLAISHLMQLIMLHPNMLGNNHEMDGCI